ncbi:hypothetical protein [Bacteroides sp.]|jgi:hypothetical protein|uniref:hypothetical protein n=1 Tax=Bacteroides sp. TaxID=29523 RepID=UPI0026327DC9|nr:hypothetical protein [Bacteroides sp.]MDD3038092.1 hypothetical protein [Bacteroides sp.]
MKVICTQCGRMNVSCEAVINPNTKEFKEFTSESFFYGFCNDCNESVILTDVDETMDRIQAEYNKYVNMNNAIPKVASCKIVWKDTKDVSDVRIALSLDCQNDDDDDIFFYCNSYEDLKSLSGHGGEDFIVTEIYNFQED